MSGVSIGGLTSACNPADPWLALSAIVDEVSDETPGVVTYHIRIQDDAAARRFRFWPGQFNMLYLPGLGEIAISISGNPAAGSPIPHTIREGGRVTQALARQGRGAAWAPRPIRDGLARRGLLG